MRAFVSCLCAAAVVLCVAAGADGQARYRDRLTFNDVGLDGHKRLLSRHGFFAISQSLSPDHQHLVYVPWSCDGCGQTQVRIADVRSGDDHLLLLARRVSEVAWSPDGRTIAVSMQRATEETGGLWLVAPDGSDLRRGPVDGGRDIAWSPDSRWLAFDFDDSNRRSHIGVALAESGTTRDLAEGFSPHWSPNGRLVLFQYVTGKLRQQPRVGVVSAAGGHFRTVARGHDPVWSPNGRQIAFLRFYDDPSFDSLWIDSIYGKTPRRIAEGTAQMAPIWSPDGRKVAFARTRLHSRVCRANRRCEGLFVAEAAGGAPRLLTRETRAIQPLAWSRNGRRILYAGIIYPGG